MLIEQLDTEHGRMYYEAGKGKPVPSVTTVLEVSQAGGGLLNWYSNLAVEAINKKLERGIGMGRNVWLYRGKKGDLRSIANGYINQERQRHLDVGDALHYYIESGELRYNGDSKGHPWFAAAVEAYDLMVEENYDLLKFESHEKRILVPGEYGGTIDAVGQWRDEPMAFEFKTSRRVLPNHAVQVAAYARALNIDKAVVCRFDKYHADYEMVWVNVERGAEIFDSALRVWKALHTEVSTLFEQDVGGDVDLENLEMMMFGDGGPVLKENKYGGV